MQGHPWQFSATRNGTRLTAVHPGEVPICTQSAFYSRKRQLLLIARSPFPRPDAVVFISSSVAHASSTQLIAPNVQSLRAERSRMAIAVSSTPVPESPEMKQASFIATLRERYNARIASHDAIT
jgi:hypothetical protein